MTTPEPHDDLDLSAQCRLHVVGVGGAGMGAIASVLVAMGHTVSGSDLKESSGLDRLRAEGVEVQVGHDAAHLGEIDFLTRSTAVADRNPEVAAAFERGVPVLSRADVLAAISRERTTVAVAGTHGKTTTSSMLAVVLVQAGLAPSFIIGGEVNEIGSGAVWSTEAEGPLVIEADESDGTFLRLDATSAIVTSVEPDHLAYWGTEEALRSAFERFVDGPSDVVLCIDDPGAASLAARVDPAAVVTYGRDVRADYVIGNYRPGRTQASFVLAGPEGELGEIVLPTPGIHNVRNATAAAAMAMRLGATFDDVQAGLGRFGGVARRFQFRGSRDGITFIDDYAHLPGEVALALDAAKGGDWGRVVCVFQPHRYTRTSDVGADFADAFVDADELVVTGIYSAGETAIPGVTGKLVADSVARAHPDASVRYVEHRDDLAEHLRSLLADGDLCLTLGAGDLTTLPDELLRG